MPIVYMPLLDEGTDVWSPVEAMHLSGDLYRVDGTMPANEKWVFPQGAIIRCKRTTIKEGLSELTVVGVAD